MMNYVRWIVITALFAIPLLPLYVSPDLFFLFITGKGFAFRILVEIALAGWAVLALAEPKYRPKFSWTLALYAAFTLWMFIADALAVSPMKAFWSNFERMDGWVTLIHMFAFFVIAGSVLSVDKLWRRWWLVLLAVSAVVCLEGVIQLLCSGSACGAPGSFFAIHQGGVRVDSSFGNAIYLAQYLLFCIAVAVWQAIESKDWQRYALFALALLQAVLLYFTATRGAILALIIGTGVAAILWAVSSGKRGRTYALTALAVLVVVAGTIYLARDTSFVKSEPTLARITSIGAQDLVVRGTLWHMAWEGFLARPVTGWGQEGFNYVFNTYYDPSMYAQEAWFDRAHNTFIDWFVAGGPLATLLFIALLISAVVAWYRSSSVPRMERIVLTAAMAAYAVQAIVEFDNLLSYIILAAFLALAHEASSRPFKSLEKMSALKATTVGAVAVPVSIVAFVIVVWFVNVPNIATAHELLLALSPQKDLDQNLAHFKAAAAQGSFGHQEISEQLVSFASAVAGQQNVPTATRTAVVSYAIEQINQEIQNRPKDARILLEASLAYRAAGDLQDALKATDAALALSPNKQQILIEEGTTKWQLGDSKGASEAYNKAYTLATENDDAAAYAAAGDIIAGDVPGGRALLLQHFATTTVDNDALLYAYYQVKRLDYMLDILKLRAQTTGSVEAGFRLASAYVLAGQYANARATIDATVKAHPEASAAGAQLLTQIQGK